MTATAPAPAPAAFGLGHALRLGISRVGYEVRSYFRQGDTVFFTFLFPLLMLSIFSVAFSSIEFGQTPDGEPLTAAQYYLPAMLAAGVLLSGLQNLATDIAMEKGDGTLKRLAGTPLPVVGYFIGKIGQVLVTATLQAALIIVVAWLAFGVTLPTDPEAWLTFAWVFLLGVTTCAILGIGLSALPRTGKSATAVVIPIVLVLQFISGVYIQFSMLPEWLQNIANVFPLAWLAHGMRAVFLPDSYAAMEAGGEWNLTGILLVCGIWLVAGLVLTRLTFRWIRKDG
ncbi:ABC transporter permease [Protaetiibacter intestinalis]|uniref:ABC transporter permease n=1 Tax=Protaetiibacter intestinalis TaxID=2419774 RepID=A0A387B723_9MICO|nr:ABC transporter permease [Protaetiibacter intestinalis]AYF98147.1 ABC transporter permease [Protaetiibacter intestinalis]